MMVEKDKSIIIPPIIMMGADQDRGKRIGLRCGLCNPAPFLIAVFGFTAFPLRLGISSRSRQ
jgi:hypothetical protein